MMAIPNFVKPIIDLLRHNPTPRTTSDLNDLECLSSECVFEQDAAGQPLDALKYFIFEISERPVGGPTWHGFRVIKLSELKYLPQEARADPALIRKQAALIRGLYASQVEMITLHYGIFDPPLGVVQCYGAAARHETREIAIQLAESAQAAVIASLTAQYAQSRFAPLTIARGRWLWEALKNMQQVTTLIGQPDPREGARGGGQESGGTRSAGSDYSEQQNEILFRAMARAREEFLFLNIATPIARRDVAGMLESLANLSSPFASRQQGTTSIGFGVSLPVILSLGQSQSANQSYGTSQSEGVSQGVSQAHGTAHSEGVANSSGWSYSQGVSHSQGVAESDSVSHSSGVTHSSGVSQGTSEAFGTAQSQSESHTSGLSHTEGTFSSSSVGGSHSESVGGSHTETDPAGMGSAVLDLAPVGLGGKLGYSDNITGPTVSDSASWGVSNGASWANSSGTSSATTTSEATTVGASQSQSHSLGVSQSASETVSYSDLNTVGHATTHSQAVSNSETYSVSGSRSVSQSNTVSESQSQSLGRNYSNGVSLGRALGAAQSLGLGAGVAPSASISKSFQWKDEAAVALTQLLEQQLDILKEASEEGGFYSDVFLLTRTGNGQRIGEAAAVQAFGGSQGVVTHLQTRRPVSEPEIRHLLEHARSFTPSTLTESLGWVNGYAYSTVVTPTQQAAYSAPGLFEEGPALTIQERTPPFAFMPDLKGEAILGFLYSTERGELTRAPLRLAEARHFHTVFAADTGFGKTVAAERLAVEAVKEWHHRVVVLDFGAGWRRLVNGPLPAERVDLYQLFPGAPRPFRWNFMQIGKRLDPDRQYMATAELIANAGRMGPRQLGYIKKAMWELYVEFGVLTTDPAVYGDPVWGRVSANEAAVLRQVQVEHGRPSQDRLGVSVMDLLPFERQALSVQRSKQVNIITLHQRLREQLERMPKGDQTGRTSLEGILIRLEPFTHGELAVMYGGSDDTLAIEDLGLLGPESRATDRWGLCVLEGGAEMDDYSKAVILSLVAWHLYNDSIVRRRESAGGFNRPLNIVFEEANKILSGASNTIGNEGGTTSRAAAVELWQQMWRDGRKYGIYLHPIVQTLSELPAGIQSSCNNAFFGQMKNLADRDLAVGHLARSERGFIDEEYKRYLSRIPSGLAIVKLGYSEDVAEMEPMLAKPLKVTGTEPNEVEMRGRLGSK